MAIFTIRVVLHGNATWEDYEALHERLANVGVVDLILSDDGEWYQLPPAEYNYQGTIGPEDLRSVVKQIADTVKRPNAVLVTHAQARYWIGLKQVPAPGN